MDKLRKFFDHLHAHENLDGLIQPLLISTAVSVIMIALVGPLSTTVTCCFLLLVSIVVNLLRWRIPLTISYAFGAVILLSLRSNLPGGVYSPEFIASAFAVLALVQSMCLKEYWHGEILLIWLLACNGAASLLDGSATLSVWIVIIMFFNLGQMLRLHVRNFSLGTLTNSLKSAMRTTFYALPMLFIFVYVFERSYANKNHFSETNVSGISTTLEPGRVSKLTLRSGTAYRIVTDRVLPPLIEKYWRVATLTRSRGLSWGRNDRTNSLLRPIDSIPKDCKITQKVYAQDYDTKNSAVGLDRVMVGAPALESPFQMTSYICNGVVENNLSVEERANLLKVETTISPKVQKFVKDLSANTSSPADLVSKILLYFKTQKFKYTLEPAIASGETLENFLFTSREGYCEHYSAALGTLLRIGGVPSRVVVGFEGGLYNRFGDYWLISFQDAHAWTEFWDGKRWLRTDPTSVLPRAELEGLKGARNYLTRLGSLPVLESLWLGMDTLFFNIQQLFSGRGKLLTLDDFTMDPYLALGSLLLLFVFLQIKKAWQPVESAVREQFQNLCLFWAGHGVRRRRSEGYEAYRQRVVEWMASHGRLAGSEVGPQIQAVNELFSAYSNFRFGPGKPTKDELRELIGKTKRLHRKLKSLYRFHFTKVNLGPS